MCRFWLDNLWLVQNKENFYLHFQNCAICKVENILEKLFFVATFSGNRIKMVVFSIDLAKTNPSVLARVIPSQASNLPNQLTQDYSELSSTNILLVQYLKTEYFSFQVCWERGSISRWEKKRTGKVCLLQWSLPKSHEFTEVWQRSVQIGCW